MKVTKIIRTEFSKDTVYAQDVYDIIKEFNNGPVYFVIKEDDVEYYCRIDYSEIETIKFTDSESEHTSLTFYLEKIE